VDHSGRDEHSKQHKKEKGGKREEKIRKRLGKIKKKPGICCSARGVLHVWRGDRRLDLQKKKKTDANQGSQGSRSSIHSCKPLGKRPTSTPRRRGGKVEKEKGRRGKEKNAKGLRQ